MSLLQNSNAISAGGYDINNSVRLRNSATAYFSKTFSANPTTRTICHWHWIVKRGKLGSDQRMFSGYSGTSGDSAFLNFKSDDTFQFNVGGSNGTLVTTAVFRDPSAWYIFDLAFDSTQATASNRAKFWVNGVLQTWAGGTVTLNSVTEFALANANNRVGSNWDSSLTFDGYMAEAYFIDGQALTPSSFGETDTTTGSWKPKAYTGTFGTNGFYLKFSDIATTSGSNAGLGKDFSGNANYWTTNNISVTAGTTYDAMIDSPTLTSATVANYAVMNPLWKDPSFSAPTFSEANLKVTSSSGGFPISTIGMSSGKWYWETTVNNVANNTNNNISITTAPFNSGTYYRAYAPTGEYYDGSGYIAYGATYTNGDIIGVALDMDNQTLTFYKNGTSQGQKTSIGLTGQLMFASVYQDTTSCSFTLNFGQRPFSYTPPSGFVRLNTYNLPDSTIKKGSNSFGVLTYTGNGSTSVTRSDTNAVNFTPDFVWIKERSGTDYHNLFDINRVVSGDHKRIYCNDTTAEESSTYFGTTNLNGFVNGGFTTGDGGNTNTNGDTYVAWCWDANGSPVSNTSGTITSNVSVNTTAGFSIVTYTGNGTAGATVGHGLGVAPKMFIVKNRVQGTYGNWTVWHTTLTGSQYLALNATTAIESNNNRWNGTVPTSTVFSLGADSFGNTNKSGDTYVAYCWSEISGFSKFGSYTGNGSADGTFVYTGFRPRFLIWKRTDSTSNWWIIDTARVPYNTSSYLLFANLPNVEYQGGGFDYDILSNGFKFRNGDAAGYNASGASYIYMAFAENPFKNSNAR
jgi:hypothetical protein